MNKDLMYSIAISCFMIIGVAASYGMMCIWAGWLMPITGSGIILTSSTMLIGLTIMAIVYIGWLVFEDSIFGERH